MSAVIPGMACLALLWLHGRLNVRAIMSANVFGYKTTVCLGLIASYVLGKLLITPGIMLTLIGKSARSAARVGNTPFEQWMKDKDPKFRQFFAGAVAAPLYLTKSPFMQLLSVMNAEIGFFSAMSMCFLVVSFTAPSKRLMLLEILLWLLCAVASYARQQETESQLALFMGAAIADAVGRMSPEDRKLVWTIMQALGKIANEEASTATGAAP